MNTKSEQYLEELATFQNDCRFIWAETCHVTSSQRTFSQSLPPFTYVEREYSYRVFTGKSLKEQSCTCSFTKSSSFGKKTPLSWRDVGDGSSVVKPVDLWSAGHEIKSQLNYNSTFGPLSKALTAQLHKWDKCKALWIKASAKCSLISLSFNFSSLACVLKWLILFYFIFVNILNLFTVFLTE